GAAQHAKGCNVSSLAPAQPTLCTLEGVWTNQLKSLAILYTRGPSNGYATFSGRYVSKVSTAAQPHVATGIISGAQHLLNQKTFGFSVLWLQTGHTTVWTGQCFVNERGEEELRTVWLLRAPVKDQEENWSATR
uniref:AVID protein n=1 Tax=Callorhinchus milii TaxID=7868 RepID=A0A4W3GCZ6_CALMI